MPDDFTPLHLPDGRVLHVPSGMPADQIQQIAEQAMGTNGGRAPATSSGPTMSAGPSSGAPFSPTAQLAPGTETRKGEIGTLPNEGTAVKSVMESAPLVAAAALQPEIAVPALLRSAPGRVLNYALGASARTLLTSLVTGGEKATEALADNKPVGQAAASGVKQGAVLGAIGEGGALGLKGLAAGAMWTVRKAVDLAERTPLGKAVLDRMATAVNEEAKNTAEGILNKFYQNTPKEVIGEDVGKAARDILSEHPNRAALMYEVPKQFGKDVPVDVTPLAQRAKSVVLGGRSGSFIDPMIQPEGRIAETVGKAGVATRPAQPLITRATRMAQEGALAKPLEALPEETGKTVDSLVAQAKAIQQAKTASVSDLIDLRRTIGQIAADPNAPSEAKVLADKLLGPKLSSGKYELDQTIYGNLLKSKGPEAAASFEAAQAYWREGKNVLENALYGIAKKSPERLGELIAPNRPDMPQALRSMAKITNQPNIIPETQRQFLDNLAADGVAGIKDRVASYGQKTIDTLFQEPEAKQTLNNLVALSKATEEKLLGVGVKSQATRDALDHALQKASYGVLAAGVGGGAYGGYRTGGVEGAIGGALAGAALPFAPAALVKLSRNPVATRKAIALLDGMQANPAAITAFAKLISGAGSPPKAQSH